MNDLISIIVPVYNSDEYLPECIDTIINQTYKNLQIILVDDCSKKSVADMCDGYAKKDNRIEVYHRKKNGGQSAARNEGLKHVKGEWIAFSDNDDTLEPEMLETLLSNAKKYKVKVSGCAHNIVDDGKVTETVQLINHIEGINKPDYYLINAMYRPKNAWIDVWTKLYHKSLINHLSFPEGCQMEDFFVNLKLFYQLDKFAYTSRPLYNWRVLEKSQSHIKYFDNRFTYYETSENIRKWFERNTKDNEILQAAYTFECCCKIQLLKDMVSTKNKENIKLAKSKLKDVEKLFKNMKVSKEFKLKSYLAYRLRLLRVKFA